MEEEEVAREDEEDAEVMAVVAAEVCGAAGPRGEGGAVFTKSQAESAAPFVDATDGDGRGAAGGEERRGG